MGTPKKVVPRPQFWETPIDERFSIRGGFGEAMGVLRTEGIVGVPLEDTQGDILGLYRDDGKENGNYRDLGIMYGSGFRPGGSGKLKPNINCTYTPIL